MSSPRPWCRNVLVHPYDRHVGTVGNRTILIGSPINSSAGIDGSCWCPAPGRSRRFWPRSSSASRSGSSRSPPCPTRWRRGASRTVRDPSRPRRAQRRYRRNAAAAHDSGDQDIRQVILQSLGGTRLTRGQGGAGDIGIEVLIEHPDNLAAPPHGRDQIHPRRPGGGTWWVTRCPARRSGVPYGNRDTARLSGRRDPDRDWVTDRGSLHQVTVRH